MIEVMGRLCCCHHFFLSSPNISSWWTRCYSELCCCHHFLQVRLEVMGKKAKNATFISGNEAGKISKEIQKVEKRRIIKSTLCNERSSRSHCMVWLL